MAESFLEDQLKRIREMSEQMTRASHGAAELTEEFARSRAPGQQDPLHEVKDCRTYSYPERQIERRDEHPRKPRRHLAHESSRRRRP